MDFLAEPGVRRAGGEKKNEIAGLTVGLDLMPKSVV